MNKWNGKVGDVVEPKMYWVKWDAKIGFIGGGVAKGEEILIGCGSEIVLLDVGERECVAHLTEHVEKDMCGEPTRKHQGLVFKIPTKVLVEWHKKEEAEKVSRARDVKVNAKRDKQNELDRAKWC